MSIRSLEGFYILVSHLTKSLYGSTATVPFFGAFLERQWGGITPDLKSLLVHYYYLHDQNIYKALATVLVAVKNRRQKAGSWYYTKSPESLGFAAFYVSMSSSRPLCSMFVRSSITRRSNETRCWFPQPWFFTKFILTSIHRVNTIWEPK